MGVRLHSGGKTRAWLGRQLGGDERLGDRAWRRCLHLFGGAVLLVYVLPRGFLIVLPSDEVLLILMGAILVLELLRRHAGWELPTIRPWEQSRVASYAYFALGLGFAALVFPRSIAVPAILGAVLLDPALGELRHAGISPRSASAIGLVAYAALAGPLLFVLGAASPAWAVVGGLVMAGIAVAVEGPRSWVPLDDDLTMTVLPGLAGAIPLWIAAGGIQLPAF